MADVTPILINGLASQSTLSDSDYFIVGGSDAKKISVAEMKEALGINALNGNIQNISNAITVYSYRRTGDANGMPGGENETNFFMIDSATATPANHFPDNRVAGCLMVMNLYNTHIIQRYYAINGKVYERRISSYMGGGSWTAWEEK